MVRSSFSVFTDSAVAAVGVAVGTCADRLLLVLLRHDDDDASVVLVRTIASPSFARPMGLPAALVDCCCCNAQCAATAPPLSATGLQLARSLFVVVDTVLGVVGSCVQKPTSWSWVVGSGDAVVVVVVSFAGVAVLM